MGNQCVVYVSDIEYLFPTIVSALMARRHTRTDTDILLVLTEAMQNFSDIRSLLKIKGIQLIDGGDILDQSLGRVDGSHFQRRISKSAMAKLVVHDVLPERYTQIIYLDGDTQILSSLEQLENEVVPSGKFMAARDYLGVSEFLKTGEDKSRYFNSGVFKFNRDGWIGREALDAFIKDPEACGGLHDQGALNYVAGSSLILISSRWNFPKQYLHLVKMSSLKVVHYMAHPKPWHGVFFPWTTTETLPYHELKQDHPLFKDLYRGISLDRKLAYKYRSLLEQFGELWNGKTPSSRVNGLLVGDYPV